MLLWYIVICILIVGYSIITNPKWIWKYMIDYRLHYIINMNDTTLKYTYWLNIDATHQEH